MKERCNLRVPIGIISGFLIQLLVLTIIFLQPGRGPILHIPLIDSFFWPFSEWEIDIGRGIPIGYYLCWSLIVFSLPGIITGLICGKKGWLYALIIPLIAMWPVYYFLLSDTFVDGWPPGGPPWYIECLSPLTMIISNFSFAALFGLIGSFLYKLIDGVVKLK